MTSPDRPKLALLIDGQNIAHCNAKDILAAAHKLGNPVLRRVYADWSKENVHEWLRCATDHGISPIQTPQSAGKNAADVLMTIDAMDLLGGKTFGGFVIVSSDSDFTALATRIREAGLCAFGIGHEKASEVYKNACTKFVDLTRQEGAKVPDNAADLIQMAIRKDGPGDGTISTAKLGIAVRAIVGRGYSHQEYGGKSMSAVVTASGKFRIVDQDDQKFVYPLKGTAPCKSPSRATCSAQSR